MDAQRAAVSTTRYLPLLCLLASRALAGDTPQTVWFSGLTTNTHTLTALASSGLDVSFTSNTPDVCRVSYTYLFGGVMPRFPYWAFQLVGLGMCSVTASQAGNATYAAATPVTRTLSIAAPMQQAIEFSPFADINLQQVYVGLGASATSGLAVSYASLTPAVCVSSFYEDGSAGIDAPDLVAVAPGVCTVAASQSGNGAWLAASTVTQSFTIHPAPGGASQTISFVPPANVTFGQTNTVPLNVSASSSLPVSLTSTSPAVCSVSGASAVIVGVGPCLITASQPGNGTYLPAFPVTLSFRVAPAHASDVNINYVQSAALGGQYSPGSLFSIYGNFMASGTLSATAPLPLASNGTTVTFNGSPCPLLYVSGTQINAQIPADAVPGSATVTVTYNGTSANDLVQVLAASPAFFTGNGLAIAQHGDYSLVTVANPARAGEIVTFYGTGIGPVSPAVASGQPAPGWPNLAVSTATYKASIGGASASVSYLGLAPTLAGVMQLNLEVPAQGPSGLLSMVLVVNGVSSPAVTIPVGGQ